MTARPGSCLHDDVALAEIELYAEVLVAAAQARRRLTLAELDRILGVTPPTSPVPASACDDPPTHPPVPAPRRRRGGSRRALR